MLPAVRRIALPPLILLVAACGCSRTVPLPPSDATELAKSRGVTAPSVLSAAARLDNGDADAAFETLVDFFRDDGTRRDPDRDVALYLASGALAAEGDGLKAFFYLDELLDTYPGSDLYYAAAERQYHIADAGLDRATRGFDLLPNTIDNDSLEMLFRVQQRVPGSELAERALLRSADHYFEAGDYDFAEDAYTVFAERFPRSPDLPRARLRQAWSNLLQYEGPRYDPTPLLDAGQQFEQFAARYPELWEGEDLAEVRAYVDQQLAEKQAIQAAYYDRVDKEGSAELMRRRLARTFPDTEAGREAVGSLPPATRPAEVPAEVEEAAS